MNGNDIVLSIMAISFLGMIIFYHVKVRELNKKEN